MISQEQKSSVLVHLTSGIGNIVLSTPLLIALSKMEFNIDLLISADYAQTADLFKNWSLIRAIHNEPAKRVADKKYSFLIPAIPPFYWPRFASLYRNVPRIIRRPPDSLFYQDEQEYYLAFARTLGCPVSIRPYYCLPIGPSEAFGVTSRTLVIAPGCKTGEMAAKRWSYFPQLAEAFEDVAVVGTRDDLYRVDGAPLSFPSHTRLFIDKLPLRETAELLATAGVVVGNDSGLSHIAAAVGTPTVMLFGPTPHHSLGQFPPNVSVLRAGLACEPCWFAARYQACAARIDCLRSLAVESVAGEIELLLGLRGPSST